MELKESDLIYDWNRVSTSYYQPPEPVELDDETLRDGLQSPSVRSPSIEEKLQILHLMVSLGIESVDIGLPAASQRVFDDTLRLAQEIADQRLPISPNAAARTVIGDIEPIIEISQRAGIAVEVSAFIGSSPIRQYAEAWNIDRLLDLTEKAVRFAVSERMPVMYVTEDTTRAKPEDLRRLYTTAVEAGARRICVADTTGHATPPGAGEIILFIRQVLEDTGEEVKIDWHGHRDRDLSVANALAAASSGASRLHGTILGVGERVGNTPLDLLLVNLELLGWSSKRDLTKLSEYCRVIADTTGVPFPDNYPIFGKDAFRTATGVHAAAIIKARTKGDAWLADRVYSSVPASLVGCRQLIEVGPMSGESNVFHWLKEHGYPQDPALVQVIFERAKEASTLLTEEELREICRQQGFHASTEEP